VADREGYGQWITSWQAAVSTSVATVGLVDLQSTRFLGLSPLAAELLGTTPEAGVGLSYLDFAERPSEAATTFRLAAEGMLDAFQARRRFRRPDKSKVEVRSCGWAIRSRAGPDLGLWVVGDEVTAPDDEAPPPPAEPPEPSMTSGPEGRHLAIAALDPSWRVTQVSPVANEMLGWRSSEFIGTSITELAHPEDRVALLVAFARATTGVTATARLRLRQHDGRWRTVRVTMSVAEGTGVPVFGFAI
jgi:PAS domain S-box-containing protein